MTEPWSSPDFGLRKAALFLLVSCVGVAVIAAIWKFGFEEWADPFLPGDHGVDSDAERWEFVVASAVLSLLALLAPTLIMFRLVAINLAAGRLSRSIFRLAPQPMMVTTANQHVLAVNLAWQRFTGIEQGEVAGKSVVAARAGLGDEGIIGRVMEMVGRCGSWCGEIEGSRKDGSFCCAWLSVTAIGNADGLAKGDCIWVYTDITDQKRREAAANHAALHDPLTGLPNRRLLRERLGRALLLASQSGGLLGLLYIDLDGFKPVNDSYGHDAGDQALRVVAHRLIQCARRGDMVARIGGDEFVMLVGSVSGEEDVVRVANRCIAQVRLPVVLNEGTSVVVGASIGIALSGANAVGVDELLQRADQAMYEAKRMGRGRWAFAT